jgi:hypothetical protein
LAKLADLLLLRSEVIDLDGRRHDVAIAGAS